MNKTICRRDFLRASLAAGTGVVPITYHFPITYHSLMERRHVPKGDSEVGRLLADGLTEKEIAIELRISEKAVQDHRESFGLRFGRRKRVPLLRRLFAEHDEWIHKSGPPNGCRWKK